jgi:heat shock protein HslJ/membrane-bound inhibitor of C-type lysozyme
MRSRHHRWIEVGLLAGCAGAPAPGGTPDTPPAATTATGTTVYSCADSVRFSVRPRGDSVVVALPQGAVTLPRQTSGSGARYSAAGVTFWSKGRDARLEQGEATSTGCVGRPAGDPWEEALLLGVDFRAVGQEPGWVLDFAEGRYLRYIGDYGGTTVFAPAPEAVSMAGGGVTWRARDADGREIVVTARETPCRDAMSGQEFTHTVSVRLEGREANGCGRALLSGDMTERYWKLVELGGRPPVSGQAAREPHLRLREQEDRVTGSTGCNSFGGEFEREGERIRFGRMVTTLMACTDTALMAQEREFLRMLEEVDRAGVVGDDMTLYAGDRPLARFTAVYFR